MEKVDLVVLPVSCSRAPQRRLILWIRCHLLRRRENSYYRANVKKSIFYDGFCTRRSSVSRKVYGLRGGICWHRVGNNCFSSFGWKKKNWNGRMQRGKKLQLNSNACSILAMALFDSLIKIERQVCAETRGERTDEIHRWNNGKRAFTAEWLWREMPEDWKCVSNKRQRQKKTEKNEKKRNKEGEK